MTDYCPSSCNFAHFTKACIPSNLFTWERHLKKSLNVANNPPLGAFNDNIPLSPSRCKFHKIKGFFIEFSVLSNHIFWYYQIKDVVGYYLLISPLGNPDEVIWINVLCPHYRGFSHTSKKTLKSWTMRAPFWTNEAMREQLLKTIHGQREIGAAFVSELQTYMINHKYRTCKMSIGNTVELFDKNFFGSMKQAFIKSIAANGHMIELYYRPTKKKELPNGKKCEQLMKESVKGDNEKTFWVTAFSQLFHPVGWAKEVGHVEDLPFDCQCMPRHSAEPGKNFNTPQFEQLFDKTTKTPKFKKGQKLEMVEPSTLNCITVGTIVKVLGYGNLMIAADGKGGKLPKGDEQICVPANSPFLLPVGYCDKYRTQLKPPPHYRGKFLWPDYLMDTGSVQAPDECFVNFEAVNYGKPRLTVGSRVETVDVVNPSTILAATVMAVAGHLVKLNFDSWPATMDQWKYMYSDDIFPVGFCELVGFDLMPPKKYLTVDNAKNFGVTIEVQNQEEKHYEIPTYPKPMFGIRKEGMSGIPGVDDVGISSLDDVDSDSALNNIPGVEELIIGVEPMSVSANEEDKENCFQ